MDNYHYIIASLPYLTPEFGSQQFSYNDFEREISKQLSKKDCRLIDWLNFGTDENNLSIHFYNQVKKLSNPFLSSYFAFDQKIRNAQVGYISKITGKKEDDYTIGDAEEEFEEYSTLTQAFEIKNIIEREQTLDKIRWNKISEIVTFHYFDINVILAFLAKGKIVKRWLDMDKEKGAKLVETLVDEVRGTVKGINNNYK